MDSVVCIYVFIHYNNKSWRKRENHRKFNKTNNQIKKENSCNKNKTQKLLGRMLNVYGKSCKKGSRNMEITLFHFMYSGNSQELEILD